MVCGAWRIVYGALAHLEVEQRVAVAQVVLQPAQHAAQHVRVAVGDELHAAEQKSSFRLGQVSPVRSGARTSLLMSTSLLVEMDSDGMLIGTCMRLRHRLHELP